MGVGHDRVDLTSRSFYKSRSAIRCQRLSLPIVKGPECQRFLNDLVHYAVRAVRAPFVANKKMMDRMLSALEASFPCFGVTMMVVALATF